MSESEIVGRADRYHIRGSIGKGSVAEVFDAEMSGDQGFVRRVAIKRLLPEAAAEEQFVRAFIDEGRILAALHHPNICGVFDFGSMNGSPFLVLEHVDGKNGEELAASLDGRLPLEIALFIACELGRALDYAHTATGANGELLGIVHRDVNPKNILISWRGDVKLTDFGIALSTQRLEKTRAGVVKGTLAYMAPEQLTGKDVDRRADIFALGCTLHRLLSGASPFVDAGVRREYLAQGKLVLDARLPRPVFGLLEKALRLDRAQRFASAAELVAEADAIMRASLDRDPRELMRDFMLRLRPSLAPKAPKHRVGDLFDIQLIGGGSADFSASSGSQEQVLRRFQTIGPDQSPTEQVVPGSERRTQSMPGARKDPLLGTFVHGYQLVEFLGQGAWANVYRGKHKFLDQECAIKIMRPDRGDSVQAKRIHREAKIAGKLQHRNLLRVLDCGELENGAPFLTMELLRGEMFNQILWKEAPLDLQRTVNLLRQLAAGLSEAHRHGLVHRDLKPTNIMLVEEDGAEVVKILDFGIAMAIDPEIPMTRLTAQRALLGTPRYMAPEQIKSASTVEQSADMYALGAILYIMLTGRPPFVGSVEQLLEQHLNAEPKPPPHAQGLGPMAMRLLAKDAQARPAAEELLEFLEQLELTRVTEVSRPGSATEATVSRTFVPPVADTRIIERATRLREVSSRGVRGAQRIWGLAGLVLAAAVVVFAGVQWGRVPPQVATELAPASSPADPTVTRAEPRPGVAARPREQEVETEIDAPDPTKKVAVTKLPSKNRSATPSSRELDQTIALALSRRGLFLRDLAELPNAALALASFNADKSPTTAAALIAAIEAETLEPALLKSKLDRILKRLEQKPREIAKIHEPKYFELRERLRPKLSRAEIEALFQEAAKLERNIQP